MARNACLEGEGWLGCWWKGTFQVKLEMDIGLDEDGNVKSVKAIKPGS